MPLPSPDEPKSGQIRWGLCPEVWNHEAVSLATHVRGRRKHGVRLCLPRARRGVLVLGEHEHGLRLQRPRFLALRLGLVDPGAMQKHIQ